MAAHRKVELLAARDLSPSVRGLTFRCSDGRPLEFEAGQWLNLHVPTAEGTLRRAYSIASRPDGALFELGVTMVEGGAVSGALHALPRGAVLEIDGPHGFFTRTGAEHTPALFVGTGSGLCPLRAMLQSELAQPSGPPLGLLFGCRREEDILWRAELEAFCQNPRFSLHVTLSRADDRWSGLRGYVQDHLPSLIDRAAPPHVYICGVSRMVGAVRKVLKQELGYDRRFIHSERYD